MAVGVVHDGSKTVTTAGTPNPLATPKTMCNWILMQPLVANAGSVYVGASTVTATRGIIMASGDSVVVWPMVSFNCYDLNAIYIDAANSADGVQFIYTSI